MGRMKEIFMLIRQERIEAMEELYNKSLEREEESFSFDGEILPLAKAKNIIDYAKKHKTDNAD